MNGRLPAWGLRVVCAVTLSAGLALAGATGALAAEGDVTGIERTDDGFAVLVDVEEGTLVDLDDITATVNGAEASASGELAINSDVARTTVLAIDTSNSMNGARFEAAKAAAKAYIDTAPANIDIGIVTYDGAVASALEPTGDRAAATQVVDGLGLAEGTLLYDGVLRSVQMLGDEGFRTLFLISDGADTGSTPLDDAVTAVADAQIQVALVALDQNEQNATRLRRIAGPDGLVVQTDPESLAAAFEGAADAQQRQVSVSVDSDVPTDRLATVEVTLGSSSGDIVAAAAVPGEAGGTIIDPDPVIETAPQESVRDVPSWLMYAGVGVFAIGLIGAAVLLVPRAPVAMTAESRVATYTTGVTGPGDIKPTEDSLASAKEAMAGVLRRNRSLDERITRTLEQAGSELKSSEWLLLHAGIFVGSGFLGLLIGRGNLIVGILFLVLGGFGPRLYLAFRKSRRRKAFNSLLPDTLQLMSGSLQAGLSLAQSVDTIVREGQDPVAGEFKRVLIETRLGIPLEDAFEGVAERFDSRDFSWVVMAIKIQRQVGGNLAELLDTVAATMREREYMRRQVAALAAEGKLSAWVLGGLPPAFLLYLLLANRDYVMPLFTEPMGWVMLGGAGLILAVGVFWMSRLVKVEV